ncbi:ester cyclase [Roseibium sp. SCP14]|uniref:ester cyclase n=1 Tax=Roseibium sp. SCP14 TaxID=3141375 RepID=UPI00333A45DF
MKYLKILGVAALCVAMATPSFAEGTDQGEDRNAAIAAALMELARRQAEDERIDTNLETFRALDLEIFSHQEWDRIHESHTDDVVVYMPDGRVIKGLDAHIDDMKWFFVWAPDTYIERHIVRFGQGEWSGAVGVLKGTFTEPMPMADGTTIEPTGNAYEITFTTIAHWTDEGKMDEEYLFWDNAFFFKQLGLGG